MQYFKHSELAIRYHVSLKTLHNWIDGAKQGKINLQLYNKANRTYIVNNPSNIVVLGRLAEHGKKYRNTLSHKVVTPSTTFYDLYNRRQVLDIISNLTIHHEIPRQYNYINKGANNWDNLLKRMENDKTPNLLKGTIELVSANLEALDRLLEGRNKVNIIDLGVGNARPVKELLGHLLERGVLHRYIAIDISESMLKIAKRNIRRWFDGKINFEGYVRDLSYERFDDLLVDDMLNKGAGQTINVVLLLGATPVNFRSFSDVLKVAYGSIGDGDLLMYTDKRDTEETRRYFDFHPNPKANELSPNHSFILDLMGIDESLYTVEMGFSERKRMRYIRVRLNVALTIKFKFQDGERNVTLEKDSTILLLRVWHLSVLEVISDFGRVGFTLLQSSMTQDRQYFLSISGVDTKRSVD